MVRLKDKIETLGLEYLYSERIVGMSKKDTERKWLFNF